jgi:hypothetical protein
MLPLYCYIRLLKPSNPKLASSRDAIVPSVVAKTLIPSLLLGFVLPMYLMLYPPAEASPEHQKYIAVFQMFPLWIALTQQILILVWFSSVLTQWGSNQSTGDQQTVPRFVYGAVAAFSGGIHLYFVGSVARDPSLSLIKVLVPEFQVQGFASQVLVFLKFDYLFTFFALLFWIYLEFQQMGRHDTRLVGAGLLVGTVLVGPGATAAIAWSIREHTLSEVRASKRE